MFSASRNCVQIFATWGHALSCCNMRWWSWMNCTTLGLRISSLYLCAVSGSCVNENALLMQEVRGEWTIEDWKNVVWSDESRFLWRHSDVRVRIWRKEHESMDPSCLVSTVQAGGDGVMVWGIFYWHTVCPLVPIEHRLNATAYPSIVADHVHPFMTTVYPSSDEYFPQDNAPCHKAQIISDWFLEHDNEFTLLKWPPQSPDLNTIEHLWDVVEREIRIIDVQPTNLQQLRDAIMSIWTKISEECF